MNEEKFPEEQDYLQNHVNLIHSRSISHKTSYTSTSSDVPLLGITVGQLLDSSAEKFAERDAIVSCHQNIKKSYSALKTEVDKLATGFLSLGLKKGDRIGIWSPNNYEWVLTQLAAAKAGLLLVNINPAYQANELKYCLKKAGMTAIVLAEAFKTQDYYKMISTVVDTLADSKPGHLKSTEFPELRHIIMLSDKEFHGTYKFNDVFNAGGSADQKELENLQQQIQFDDPVNIQFTSGTTGSPKGATLSHHNIVNNGFLTGRRLGFHLEVERINVSAPLYHCLGCVLGVISSISFGGCVILPAPSFSARATAEAIQKERCTTLYGTPTMYIDILHLSDLETYCFSSLKKALTGGANCPVEVMKACKDKLNIKHMLIAYGSTETSLVTTLMLPGDSTELCATTAGTVLEHVEVKIVDAKGKIVPIATPGEVWTRGFSVMLGYWNDLEKTKEAITPEGWYKTRDQAVMGQNGYFQIVGRSIELIIRGGENIYPKEIENFLHTHPKIAEVQVVGVPDSRMDEEVCAWIKLKAQESLMEEDVKYFCKGQIAHFKIPRYILFVDDFPKTVTGKIQKFIMREQTIKNLGLPV